MTVSILYLYLDQMNINGMDQWCRKRGGGGNWNGPLVIHNDNKYVPCLWKQKHGNLISIRFHFLLFNFCFFRLDSVSANWDSTSFICRIKPESKHYTVNKGLTIAFACFSALLSTSVYLVQETSFSKLDLIWSCRRRHLFTFDVSRSVKHLLLQKQSSTSASVII